MGEIEAEDRKLLLSVDRDGWMAVLPQIEQHFATFGAKLPKALAAQLDALKQRLAK